MAHTPCLIERRPWWEANASARQLACTIAIQRRMYHKMLASLTCGADGEPVLRRSCRWFSNDFDVYHNIAAAWGGVSGVALGGNFLQA